MSLIARSVVSSGINSRETALDVGRKVVEGFGGERPSLVLAYTAINHDRAAFLEGMRAAVGPGVQVIGCSTQGLVGRGCAIEAGYFAGAMGLGGSALRAESDIVHEIAIDPAEKGRELGRKLLARLGEQPKVVVIHYDPLCGADIGAMLAGLNEVVRCPVIGSGAGQPWGPMIATYQYANDRAYRASAVAAAFSGSFAFELGVSHGTEPFGLDMEVTRAEANNILELDGRPALEVWQDLTGSGLPNVDHTAALALGVPAEDGGDRNVYLVLAAFGVDQERGAIVLQGAIAQGTRVVFHHRTVQGVLNGARTMASDLRQAVAGRPVRAVLGFECGARTSPFLGEKAWLEETRGLQDAVGNGAEWLGSLAWGEVFPLRRGPKVFNYTYPLLCLLEQ